MKETNPVRKHFTNQAAGKRSMRSAINAMCATCVGCTAQLQGKGFVDRLEAGFTSEIRNCTVMGCPLREFRPYQDKAA